MKRRPSCPPTLRLPPPTAVHVLLDAIAVNMEDTADDLVVPPPEISDMWRVYSLSEMGVAARSRASALWGQMTMQEMSGSLGDLGTLIPLLVALSNQKVHSTLSFRA